MSGIKKENFSMLRDIRKALSTVFKSSMHRVIDSATLLMGAKNSNSKNASDKKNLFRKLIEDFKKAFFGRKLENGSSDASEMPAKLMPEQPNNQGGGGASALPVAPPPPPPPTVPVPSAQSEPMLGPHFFADSPQQRQGQPIRMRQRPGQPMRMRQRPGQPMRAQPMSGPHFFAASPQQGQPMPARPMRAQPMPAKLMPEQPNNQGGGGASALPVEPPPPPPPTVPVPSAQSEPMPEQQKSAAPPLELPYVKIKHGASCLITLEEGSEAKEIFVLDPKKHEKESRAYVVDMKTHADVRSFVSGEFGLTECPLTRVPLKKNSWITLSQLNERYAKKVQKAQKNQTASSVSQQPPPQTPPPVSASQDLSGSSLVGQSGPTIPPQTPPVLASQDQSDESNGPKGGNDGGSVPLLFDNSNQASPPPPPATSLPTPPPTIPANDVSSAQSRGPVSASQDQSDESNGPKGGNDGGSVPLLFDNSNQASPPPPAATSSPTPPPTIPANDVSSA